jgi:hypothetical protein
MFGSLFRRAQATVDNAVDNVVNRAIVAFPFVIAAGFGTAALSMRLNREFGAETGSLILAGAFLILGGLAALILHSQIPTEPARETAESAEHEADEAADPALASADRELLMAALATAAPIVLPVLMRALMRNLPRYLPIVAAIAAAGFIMSRRTEQPGG